MTTNPPGYNRAYLAKLKASLIELLGGCCQGCGSQEGLEFAHRHGTEFSFNGWKKYEKGRGKSKRLHDIKRHPERYILFCHDCHFKYDRENSL